MCIVKLQIVICFIFQTHLSEISKDILKLGLLHDSLRDEEASLDEPQGWLMFHHKLFQEFFGGYFAAICLEKYLVRQIRSCSKYT